MLYIVRFVFLGCLEKEKNEREEEREGGRERRSW